MSEEHDSLVREIIGKSNSFRSLIHGIIHWRRVERNGVFLSKELGIDPTVPILFAYCHDSKRKRDCFDKMHGERAAAFVEENPALRESLSTATIEELAFACRFHSHHFTAPSETIGVCWDADRLDLHRLGMMPDPKYLNTEPAKKFAELGQYGQLNEQQLRNFDAPFDCKDRSFLSMLVRRSGKALRTFSNYRPKSRSNYQL